MCSTLSGICIASADRGIVVAGQACKKAFEELRLQYSNVFRVLHSCQKQDMTSQQCTAAANMMSAHLSNKDALPPAST